MNATTALTAEEQEAADLLGNSPALARDTATDISTTLAQQPYIPRNITEERALELLGDANLSPGVVAQALGVNASRISQLLADEDFTREVTRRRFTKLKAHNSRDEKWDAIEDKLLDKAMKLLPMAHKIGDVSKLLQIANAAKRRGVSDPNAGAIQQSVVQLTLPTTIVNNVSIKVDAHNNVLTAGTKSMVTAPLSAVANMAHLAKAIESPNTSTDLDANEMKLITKGDVNDTERFTQTIPASTRDQQKVDLKRHELSEDDI